MNAVIFMVTIAFLLALPLLKSVVAFQAVVRIPLLPPLFVEKYVLCLTGSELSEILFAKNCFLTVNASLWRSV